MGDIEIEVDGTEITFEDLQSSAYPTVENIDNRPAVVYRLGSWDNSAPLSMHNRQQGDKDVYYSALVLSSWPPTLSIN
tara:strand:- start:366 stop:599 length:234 start_codon:yes stop_codon:yes gene_type:complete